jgi:ribosomal protein L9
MDSDTEISGISWNNDRKGDVLFISPAMWTNVMAPKKLAQKMSDEEVANTAAHQAAVAAEELLKARVLQDKIATMPRFVIERKVGVGKNLFGSVSVKQLTEMLKERFPDNVTSATSAIITEIKG